MSYRPPDKPLPSESRFDQRSTRPEDKSLVLLRSVMLTAMVFQSQMFIVKNGHVTLEGVVDSDADKNLVGILANGVPGTFSVNNLQVVPS
jgi:BON domain-containing protein